MNLPYNQPRKCFRCPSLLPVEQRVSSLFPSVRTVSLNPLFISFDSFCESLWTVWSLQYDDGSCTFCHRFIFCCSHILSDTFHCRFLINNIKSFILHLWIIKTHRFIIADFDPSVCNKSFNYHVHVLWWGKHRCGNTSCFLTVSDDEWSGDEGCSLSIPFQELIDF